MKRQPYRQGDVLIKPIAKIPNGLVEIPRENGRLVLAHGEVTGHAHVVEGEALFLAADIAELDNRFLEVAAECEVVHEEHGTLTLPPGNYEVIRQREYSPEEIRRVAD